MKGLLLILLLLPVFADGQVISTVAGNGYNAGTSIGGYGGDGGAATAAELWTPGGVAFHNGTLYIADGGNNRIRMVDASGIITTLAGSGAGGVTGTYGGDGGLATAAGLYAPSSVEIDVSGNLYIADRYNNRVRKVNTSGIITTIAGIGLPGSSGDGGLATAAKLSSPRSIVVDGSGNLFIADYDSSRIRKVNGIGIITTIAGNGVAGFSGDGGPATAAKLNNPDGVAVDVAGNLYIADARNNRVRRVSTSGIINAIAGNGIAGNSGDGGAATAAELNYPSAVAVDASGNVYITDAGNNRVRKVDASGIITAFAGNGVNGYSGDGGPATAAEIARDSWGITVGCNGNVYIADCVNNVIRKVPCCPISIDCTEDIGNIEGQEKTINIFPNPAITSITISAPEKITIIAITSLLGQNIYTHQHNSQQVEVDVSSLPPGLYLIRINGTEVRKFVKQ